MIGASIYPFSRSQPVRILIAGHKSRQLKRVLVIDNTSPFLVRGYWGSWYSKCGTVPKSCMSDLRSSRIIKTFEGVPMDNKNRPFHTTTTAARVLGVSRRWVLKLCQEGRLGIKLDGRYLIRQDELDKFAEIERKAGRPAKGRE